MTFNVTQDLRSTMSFSSPMQINRFSPLACCALLLSLVSPVSAQPNNEGTVEVANVRFDRVRPDWYQVDVEVDVDAAPGNTSRYVNRVGVTLHLGFKLVGASGEFQFYRAEATAVALKHGRSHIRFYLPPEIVDRDRLTGAADFWTVDLRVGNEAMPRSSKQVSSSLPNPAALESFLAKINSEAAANDGILVPQFQSPYAWSQGSQAAPSFVRAPEDSAGR